jgi:hypothetical protein
MAYDHLLYESPDGREVEISKDSFGSQWPSTFNPDIEHYDHDTLQSVIAHLMQHEFLGADVLHELREYWFKNSVFTFRAREFAQVRALMCGDSFGLGFDQGRLILNIQLAIYEDELGRRTVGGRHLGGRIAAGNLRYLATLKKSTLLQVNLKSNLRPTRWLTGTTVSKAACRLVIDNDSSISSQRHLVSACITKV